MENDLHNIQSSFSAILVSGEFSLQYGKPSTTVINMAGRGWNQLSLLHTEFKQNQYPWNIKQDDEASLRYLRQLPSRVAQQ